MLSWLLVASLSGCSLLGTGSASVVWGPDMTDAGEHAPIRIEPGKFQMGSPDWEPGRFGAEKIHEVELTVPFYIDPVELSQERYERVMDRNPSGFAGCPECPVERVSWFEAIAFCNKASRLEGLQPVYEVTDEKVVWHRDRGGYRLPTEAEWEYAARAGSPKRLCGFDQLEGTAWYGKNAGGRPHPGGEAAPNDWGLYDTCGNVREHCFDFTFYPYPHEYEKDPTGPSEGWNRINRGGSWSADARRTRVAYRRWGAPDEVSNMAGLRVVRTAPEALQGLTPVVTYQRPE